MDEPFEEMANLDRLIHEPARLAILTALSSCHTADFLFLQNLTGMSSGNLSSHLSKLEVAGLVEIQKRFEGRRPVTRALLTPAGQKAVEGHWGQLEALRQRAQDWNPPEE